MVNGSFEIGEFLYLRCESEFYDSIGDARQYSDSNGYMVFERCTVANATKGAGTWVKVQFDNRFNGCVVFPTITDNGNGTVTVANNGVYNLSKNAEGSGIIETYQINGGTFTLTDNTTNYVVANYNGGTPIIAVITDMSTINQTTIIPIETVYRNGIYLHSQFWDTLGLALANKLQQSIVRTQRYRRESGLSLSESGIRNLNLTGGTIWVGAVSKVLDAIASATDNIYFWFKNGGVWTQSIVSQYNNTQYQGATDLVELTAQRFGVNWVFRGVESQKHLYVVLGTDDYTENQAIAATQPEIPIAISSHAVLVAKLIVQKSSDTAYSVQSAFDIQFGTSGTADHANLTNLGWTASAHTGTALRLAGFDATGQPIYYDPATFLKLDQSTPQTVTQSPIINDLTPLKLVFIDSNKQIKSINALYDATKDQIQIGNASAYSDSYGLSIEKSIVAGGIIVFNGGNGNVSQSGLITLINGASVFKNVSTGNDSAIEIWTKNLKAAKFTPSQDLEVVGNITGANLSGTNTGDQDLSGLQEELVSGTNIKTINNESILGSGNLTVIGGGGTSLWTAIVGTRASNTTITVAGDQTAIFKKGMIVRWLESSVIKWGMVSIPSTYSDPNTTITIIGCVCASIDTDSFKYSSIIGVEQFQKEFNIAGTIGASGTNVAREYYANEPMYVFGADIQVGTAGTTNSTTVDINKNGTTMFSFKPALATTVAASPTPFTADTATSLALNDKVTIDIDAPVQTTPAVDLYIQLYVVPQRYFSLT